MRDGFKLAIILLVICAISSGLLGLTNQMTYPKILERRAQTEAEAKEIVMPDADDITESLDEATYNAVLDEMLLTSDTINDVYVAKKDGAVIGYVFKCEVNGFGGALQVMVGINIDGTISGAKVTSHSETVGLGAKSTDETWISQYKGLSTSEDITVVKTENKTGNQITAITGATITSRAVTSAVNYASQAFNLIIGGIGE
jgi:electron transport complex protein RnfG